MIAVTMLDADRFPGLSCRSVWLISVLLQGWLLTQCVGYPDGEIKKIYCDYYDKNDPNCFGGKCPKRTPCPGSPKPFCFASWKNDTDGFEIVMKGCWSNSENCVNKTACIQSPSIKELHFCCCEDEMCNKHVESVPYPVTTTTEIPVTGLSSLPTPPSNIQLCNRHVESVPYPVTTTTEIPVTDTKTKVEDDQVLRTLVYSIVPIVGLAAVIILIFWMWKRFRRQVYEYTQQLPTVDPIQSLPPSPHTQRPLKLIEIRAKGRFGSVWKAQLHDDTVAVKIFPLQDKMSWANEQDIYKLPQMSHSNILKFIGSEKRGDNLNIELWLITEFHPNGSLYEYLKGNTVTWSELCKIAETMTQGLSFLHDELPPLHGSCTKPAVAHRDFKSKNVLIKSDLSACIADFGLALKFEPGKNPGETHGLVGTRRYMAPEVLEGAISFNRDAFLRIDMYACGLVLWEVMSRCSVIEGTVGDYQLPFEEEIGQHPTLEDMQELVVINKFRPALRDHWLRHAGLEALSSTVEECWDHDAEARLSADCVLERITQLSRTLNTSCLSNISTPQPLIINTSQGLPPVSPVVQTL